MLLWLHFSSPPGHVITEEDGELVVAPSDVADGGAAIKVNRAVDSEQLTLKVSTNGT